MSISNAHNMPHHTGRSQTTTVSHFSFIPLCRTCMSESRQVHRSVEVAFVRGGLTTFKKYINIVKIMFRVCVWEVKYIDAPKRYFIKTKNEVVKGANHTTEINKRQKVKNDDNSPLQFSTYLSNLSPQQQSILERSIGMQVSSSCKHQ
jgi:hypothetical protein